MRSSAALSALIRLCPTDTRIASFYKTAHNLIGKPNLVLSSVDNETWEKKCYLFLVTLTWARPDLSHQKVGLATSYQTNYHTTLKKVLLRLLNSWR